MEIEKIVTVVLIAVVGLVNVVATIINYIRTGKVKANTECLLCGRLADDADDEQELSDEEVRLEIAKLVDFLAELARKTNKKE